MSDQPLLVREPPDAIGSRIAVSGLQPRRYRLVARSALSYGTRCRLVMGGRSATHVVASSPCRLGGRRRVAPVDHFAAPRATECARVHITAVGCPGTVSVLNTISAWKGRDPNRKTNQHGACDADANAATHGKADANAATDGDGDARDHTITNAASNTDTHPGSNADPDSCAPDLQPRLRDRDGKRGVEQPDR